MSDHDRGAYAPHHDGPSLSFDARRSRSRGPAPFTLIFSGVVLAALVGAIFLFYRGGVREAGAPPQTVGEPVVAMKGPASVGDAPIEEAESLDVYVDEAAIPPPATAVTASAAPGTVPSAPPVQIAATGPAPAFTAPPEQPQPRPAPRPAPPPVAVARPAAPPAPRPAAVPAARPTQTASASAAPRPGQVASITVAPRTPAAPASRPAAAPTTASARPTQVASAPAPAPAMRPTPAPAATGGGGYGVQIGAFSSQAIADAEFAKIAGSYASGRGKAVTPVPSGGATLYRTVVTGFSSREQAAAVCAQMKAAGKTCFVR